MLLLQLTRITLIEVFFFLIFLINGYLNVQHLYLSVLESGNPGGLPATYSGTVSDFSNADSVIFRPPLTSDEQQQQQHPDAVNDYRLLRTEQDSRWLNGNCLLFAFLCVHWPSLRNALSAQPKPMPLSVSKRRIFSRFWVFFLFFSLSLILLLIVKYNVYMG